MTGLCISQSASRTLSSRRHCHREANACGWRGVRLVQMNLTYKNLVHVCVRGLWSEDGSLDGWDPRRGHFSMYDRCLVKGRMSRLSGWGWQCDDAVCCSRQAVGAQ